MEASLPAKPIDSKYKTFQVGRDQNLRFDDSAADILCMPLQ